MDLPLQLIAAAALMRATPLNRLQQQLLLTLRKWPHTLPGVLGVLAAINMEEIFY
jgi:hypothetical protein